MSLSRITVFVGVIGSVLVFQSSSNLAAAYGIAVCGTMIISTIMVSFVAVRLWKWPAWAAFVVLGSLLLIDALFLASNSMKLGQGGWFALAIAIASFTTLTTWRRGRVLLLEAIANQSPSVSEPSFQRTACAPGRQYGCVPHQPAGRIAIGSPPQS